MRYRNVRKLMLQTLTDNLDSQLSKKQERKEEGNKPFKLKEMADVVEALIGTVGLNCGMQAAHEFLISLQILRNDYNVLDAQMDKVKD